MKPRTAALGVAIVLIGGLAAKRAVGPKGPKTPAPPAKSASQTSAVPVEVTAVRRGSMLRTLAVTGSLKTDNDVQITAKVEGIVRQVAVKEGDRVTAGQLLIVLDDTDQRAQVDQAQAGVRASEERLAQMLAGEKLRYTQTDAQIAQAEANLHAAQVRVQQLETGTRVTDASARSAVARAESGLAAAKDRLRMVKEGARTQERRVAENAVEQARANLDTAKARAARRRELFKQGAISQEDLDEHEKSLRLAQSQYDSAVQQRDLVQEGSRSEEVRIAEEQVRQAEEQVREARASLERIQMSSDDVDAARAQVRQLEAALKVARANKAQYQIVPSEIAAARAAVDEARARLRFAQEQLDNTLIYSPVDGVVSTRSVNVGESIGKLAVLMNLVALNGVYFEAQVPELRLSDVRTGQPVQVTVDSMPGKELKGTVRETIPVAATDSKSFRVRVSVAGADRLPVGAFARGVIELGRHEESLLVPKDCLLSIAGESYAFVVTNGAVKRQAVKIGATDATDAQILEGLKEGDQVVSSGTDVLSDGAKVKVVRAPAKPEASQEGPVHDLDAPASPAKR